MQENTLFNYVRDHIAGDQPRQYKGSTLVCTRNAQQVEYARFDLPRPPGGGIQVGTYVLTEHHISIYADMIDSSQYHYTGYFTKDKQSYQLHLYFNQQDGMTLGPLLTARDGQPSPQIDPMLSDDFASIALSQCVEIISSLRKDFSRKLIALKTTYHQVEAEATKLSEQNPMQDMAYVGKLDMMLNLLKQLTPLEKDNHYGRLERLIMRMKIAYSELAPVVKVSDCAAVEVVEISPDCHDDKPDDKRAEAIVATSVDKEIEALWQEKIAFSPKAEEKANQLCSFFSKSNELLLLLSDKQYTASMGNLRQLYSIDHWSRREGETMLRAMLKKNSYELASGLEPFFYTLSQQDIESALETQNAAKLDFLIKATGFQINGQPVKIGKHQYPTAVHYCFQHANLSNMVSVLSVLMEHGASLLVRDRGLPIAHQLLCDAEHPLHKVFTHTKKKILCKQFYKALITELQSPVTKKDSAVEQAIVAYTKKISTLHDEEYLQHMLPHQYNGLEQERVRAADYPVVSLVKEKLKLDKPLMALMDQLNTRTMAFLRQLPRNHQGNILKNAKVTLKNSMDFINTIDSNVAYEKIRPFIVDRIEKQMQLIANGERFMELHKKISTVQRGSVSKQDKRDVAEHAKLAIEIKQSEKELSVPPMIKKDDFFGSMTNIKNMLDDLKTHISVFAEKLSMEQARFSHSSPDDSEDFDPETMAALDDVECFDAYAASAQPRFFAPPSPSLTPNSHKDSEFSHAP